MDNKYFYLTKAYRRPANYKIPLDEELEANTKQPELNSREFTYKVYQENRNTKDFEPVYSFIDVHKELFVLGTNNFTTSISGGNFIGAENFDAFKCRDVSQTCFQLPFQSTVTGFKFIADYMFIATTKNSEMEMWSARCEQREGEKYNLYKCGKYTTEGYVSNIDVLNSKHKLVAGTNRGHVNIFDYGISDLTLDHQFSFGHASAITGVSANPSSNKTFVTSSIDKNCVMWDVSKNNVAAFRLLKNYESQLTAVRCAPSSENLVLLGDEVGNILSLDPRIPNKILSTKRVTNRAITSIKFKSSEQFGIIAKNNVAQVFSLSADGGIELKYKHTAPCMLYSMCWDNQHDSTFYLVGEEKFAEKIVLA